MAWIVAPPAWPANSPQTFCVVSRCAMQTVMPDKPADTTPSDGHFQFGLDDATEDYKRLRDTPKPDEVDKPSL